MFGIKELREHIIELRGDFAALKLMIEHLQKDFNNYLQKDFNDYIDSATCLSDVRTKIQDQMNDFLGDLDKILKKKEEPTAFQQLAKKKNEKKK